VHNKINALYLKNSEVGAVEIFGYTTKGIPGVDIVNLGRHGRNIKEKLIYLTKSLNIKLPMRKYTLCVELEDKHLLDNKSYQWLELPILLLFWSLAKQIPITKLDDCFTAGKISVDGQVTSIPQKTLEQFIQTREFTKVIAPSNYNFFSNVQHIPLNEILTNQEKEIFIMDR